MRRQYQWRRRAAAGDVCCVGASLLQQRRPPPTTATMAMMMMPTMANHSLTRDSLVCVWDDWLDRKEIDILKKLNHRCIVSYYGCAVQNDSLWVRAR